MTPTPRLFAPRSGGPLLLTLAACLAVPAVAQQRLESTGPIARATVFPHRFEDLRGLYEPMASADFTAPRASRLAPLPKCETCGFGSGASFVHTLAAETPPEGSAIAGIRFDWQEMEPYSDAQLLDFSTQDVEAHSIDRSMILRAGLNYGIADRISVGFDLPFVNHRNLREAAPDTAPDFEDNGDQSGLGDLSLFGQWCCYQDDDNQRFASIYGGVRLPTGATDLRGSAGDRLEPDHQPGSGSVDPFLGLAVAQTFDALTLGASAVYTLAGDGSQDSNLGDVLRVNCGFGWLPDQDPAASSAVRLMLELTSEWHERMQFGGVADDDTGGFQLFVAPGVRLTTASGWSVFASFGLPVVQDLDGEQSEVRFRFSSGVSLSF